MAPLKKVEPSDDEDVKPVNSVIRVKPRAKVSPSKQACKNLLLRAMADAQKSTLLAKTIKPKEMAAAASLTVRSLSDERNTKLYTKSYRDRLKRTAGGLASNAILRRATQNLLIQVKASNEQIKRRRTEQDAQQSDAEEEYVPAPIPQSESDAEIYVPQAIHKRNTHFEQLIQAYADEPANVQLPLHKTQFVVTMNGVYY